MRVEPASALPAADVQALIRTIEALEGQRTTLGDSVVDLAIAPLRARLAGNADDRSGGAAVDRSGERKIVTVLFVDIAGFTEMAERLGSEVARDTVNNLFDRLVPIVERYGGVVDKFIGDELMAVFGAPRAVERHAERALRAALAMFAAVDERGPGGGASLRLHAGVNTGEVVAGAVGSTRRHDYSVTGDAVNVAARLEGAAHDGEILVGPSTYRHTFHAFEFEPLEPMALKGKTQPLVPYRLRSAVPRRSPKHPDALTLPFCGRESELAALVAFASAGRQTPRGAVFVRAQPGLGKSRLVAELRHRLAGQVRWLDASGQDYRSDLSYGLVSDLLDGLVGVSDAASREEVAAAYAEYLNGIGQERVQRAIPLIFRLRGLPLDARDEAELSALGAEALRERITQAVADLVCEATADQSTVVCIEDVHWADPSSVAILRSLAEAPRLAHALFLLTTRPEQSAANAWIEALAGGDDRRRIVDLARLTEHDSRSLLDQVFAAESPAALVDQIGATAQGNPLYLASFLRSLVDGGGATLAAGRITVEAPVALVAIPDTLQAVVGAQIDRLPALAKAVLHWAAILGNSFAPPDVAHIARAEGVTREVDTMLSVLRERQLVEPESGERLRFVHALVRNIGYDQMLERERRRLHGVAARIVEEQMAATGEPTEADVALLAWHLERAGDNARASLRYEQAATLAAASHAHAEELGYVDAAIRLADVRDRRLAGLVERAGDTLQLLGRYAEAAQRFNSLIASTAAPPALDIARLNRKVARTFTPRFAADDANQAIDEARRWIGLADERGTDDWWREHFAVELFAMHTLYMQGRTEDVAKVAASIEPDIDKRATLYERGLFHRNLVLLRLREQRYRPDAATVALAALAADEVRESGNSTELCLTTFTHSFALLWHGAVEKAERAMQQVLAETVSLGDAERNLLCLVYLAVASRQLGNVESAEAFARGAIARARANRSAHYEAMAHGTLAWVAWRRGEGALADREVELAQTTLAVYPFSWIHAAVAVARAVERDDLAASGSMIARMLDPMHQRLDEDVRATFESALAAPTLATVQAVVDACRRIRYL